MIAPNVNIREALPQDDTLIAEHLYRLGYELFVPAEYIEPNYQEITLNFITQVRQTMHFGAFVASVDGTAIGSVSCQLYEKPLPQIVRAQYLKWGYIWFLYVGPDYRGQGIGKRLMSRAIDYLKSLGCSRAILHTSPLGKPVYDRLGFTSSNELSLELP